MQPTQCYQSRYSVSHNKWRARGYNKRRQPRYNTQVALLVLCPLTDQVMHVAADTGHSQRDNLGTFQRLACFRTQGNHNTAHKRTDREGNVESVLSTAACCFLTIHATHLPTAAPACYHIPCRCTPNSSGTDTQLLECCQHTVPTSTETANQNLNQDLNQSGENPSTDIACCTHF
jgi:hypothetical protein